MPERARTQPTIAARNQTQQQSFADDLNAMLEVLPPAIRQWLEEQPDLNQLLEVVLDLGRMPEARFMQRTIRLEGVQVEEYDLQYVADRIGQFGKDNRAGIPARCTASPPCATVRAKWWG
jgi:hypothetical protein